MSGSEPRVAENWDDDFDFQPVSESLANIPSTPVKDGVLSKSNALNSRTHNWAEPGPSTPSKRAQTAEAENWDDDFQDNDDLPSHSRTSPKTRRRRPTENWDDDFEDKQTSPSKKSARWDSSDEEECDFGFADREEDRTVTSRSRRGAFPSVLPDESPPPPVPPIPSTFADSRLDPQPFPRSPTASVFSVPVSGRESIAGHSYSSTAHLALRPTLSSSSFGALPPSPPIHQARERRRLRKKSRPPRVDANIYELDDRHDPCPVTPERSRSPPEHTTPHDSPPDAAPPSAGKSSLVSRIGSVGKKWGAARKKRMSTGPADIALNEPRESEMVSSRPASMAIPTSPPTSKWFFRAGGGPGAGSGSPPSNVSALPLKHEKSMDRLLAMVGFDHPETPSKRKHKIRQALPKDLTDVANKRGSLTLEPPSSATTGTSRSSSRARGSRHASYNGRQTPSSRGSSVPRSASASVDDVSSRRLSRGPSSAHGEDMRTPRKSRSSLEPEPGSRSFMGGMRRISMTGKHKRSKTTVYTKEKSPDEPARPSTSTAATAVPRLSDHTASDHGLDVTPRPPSRIMPRISIDEKPLLPPIELQPPSPPREMTKSMSEPVVREGGLDAMLEAAFPSLPTLPSLTGSIKTLMPSPPSAPPTLSKLPVSSQPSSLSRATQSPKDKETELPVFRRSSLSDLKIPARISQAQVGLRRDLGMVRDFATSVEQLRELQTTYYSLVVDIQALLLQTAPQDEPQPRAISPTLFGLPLPGYRARSNTNPQTSSTVVSKRAAEHLDLAAAYHGLETKYRMAWECAELLIELGGGTPVQPPPSASSTQLTDHSPVADGRRSRERAITLAGDEAKPAVPFGPGTPAHASQWRASTGRHDLSSRQLLLLRDMLNNPDSSTMMTIDSHLEDINREWRWGDAMSSTITLPSELSSQHGSTAHDTSGGPRRKSGRLGMRALRDMLRSLKKNHSTRHQQEPRSPPPVPPIPSSSTSMSMSTMSSLNLPKPPDPSVASRPRAKTSAGPESARSLREHPNSPYVTSSSLTHRSSPRRPSLASLFKLGQKSKSSTAKSSPSSGAGRELSRDDLLAESTSSCPPSAEEEDWDQVESASDIEAASPSGSATVRRKKHSSMYVSAQEAAHASRQNLNASQASLSSANPPPTPSRVRAQAPTPEVDGSRLHTRSTKLSDVKELAELEGDAVRLLKGLDLKSKRQSYAGPSSKRPTSRNGRTARGTGSLRSPPPAWQGPVAEHSPEPRRIALPEGGGISLAMTPENIRPLLENAREVHARCSECLGEMKSLLASHTQP